MDERRERILRIQRREHFLGKPEGAPLLAFKPGTVSGLKARGALDRHQASTANRLLVMLRREPTEPYQMAKAAIGRSAAEVIEAIIVLGEPISHYAARVGIPHAHAAGRLKAGLDTLAEHFDAYTRHTGPCRNPEGIPPPRIFDALCRDRSMTRKL